MMKVTELTQIRATPFQNGIPGNNWWYSFKCKHLEINIQHAKGLEVCKAHGLTPNSCSSFYTNL
jgi:hypothetical protein